jgi:hypothetical protein
MVEAACCPVCLADGGDEMVATPCAHVFCRRCIERVIMTTKLANPTRAPCPLCRTEISVFALTLAGTSEPLHPKNEDLSALDGCVFLQSRGGVGFASYHFEADQTPHLSYESEGVDSAGWTLDDGRRPPQQVPFQEAHFHQQTRTFHAVVEWSPTWYGSHRWEYVMQFSSDLRYICGGGVTMQRRQTPLDGRWRVVWQSGQTAEIDIEAGSWNLWSSAYLLNLHDPRQPSFKWADGTMQVRSSTLSRVEEVRSSCAASVAVGSRHPGRAARLD